MDNDRQLDRFVFLHSYNFQYFPNGSTHRSMATVRLVGLQPLMTAHVVVVAAVVNVEHSAAAASMCYYQTRRQCAAGAGH